jgi:type VI secretion system protein ImpH
METPRPRELDPGLAAYLLRAAARFSFFQAVRMLERFAPGQRVGGDALVAPEVVRFKARPSLGFPPSAVMELRPPSAGRLGRPRPEMEMVVAFMGLTGPDGILPQHYTRLIIERIAGHDHALADFLDIFNHRAISFLFRAWEKGHLAAAYERSRREGPSEEDPLTACLYSLVGLGTGGLRRRMTFDDEAFLYYSGLFADNGRPAVGLQRLLSDYFDVPLAIQPLQGQWLALSLPDRTAFPSMGQPLECHCRLGADLILGDRVWDVQGKFRVRVGPLSYAEFRRWIPWPDAAAVPIRDQALRPFCQLVRSYVGVQLEFDVQVILKKTEIPPCHLGGSEISHPFLGWTTWLSSRPADETARDSEDAIFAPEDLCNTVAPELGPSACFSTDDNQ